MSDFLDGKTIVIMGVANKRSIAWGCTQAIMNQGAKVVLTYQNNRIKKSLKRFVPEDLDLLECDVSEDENIEKAFAEIGDRYGKIDGVIHAIAYADKDTLTSGLVNTTKDGYDLAQNISAYSLIAVARYAQPVLNNP
ncbi:SDR family oxidoreductase, partial [Lactobacillus helveticus]